MRTQTQVWNEKYMKGKRGELRIDDILGKWGELVQSPPELDRVGIDRTFYVTDGRIVTLEYKTDTFCISTHNLCVEVVKNNNRMGDGWLYTNQCDWLVSYSYNRRPDDRKLYEQLYILDMCTLVQSLPKSYGDWLKTRYRRQVSNDVTYQNLSFLVPFADINEAIVSNIILCDGVITSTQKGVKHAY